jgi:hypothetical protein
VAVANDSQPRHDSDSAACCPRSYEPDSNLQEWFVAGGPGTVAWVDKSGVLVGTKVTAQASGAKVEVYDTGGSVNSRRMAMGHSSGYLITLAEAFGEHPL